MSTGTWYYKLGLGCLVLLDVAIAAWVVYTIVTL